MLCALQVASIAVVSAHGYVAAVGVASCFVMTWAGIRVGGARKKYNVEYPNMYAIEGVVPKGIEKKKADEFNCVQVTLAPCSQSSHRLVH
jgi:hypothetical protein